MSGHAYAAEGLRSHSAALPDRGRAGPARALGLAGACLLALVALWAIATQLEAFRIKDATALYRFTLLNQPNVESAGNFLLHLLNPVLFMLWGAALVAIALARGRARPAVAVVAVMALAPLTSELLKPLLAHGHVHAGGIFIDAASWPSGHATAAMALALSAVLVTPARWRPLVGALGAVFVAGVGVALLILAWHMPSDVLGGYLVATLWMALAVAALRLLERRRPSRTP